MKFLTLCVLAGVVVAMCGCTAPSSSNAVPLTTNTTHNETATANANKTTAIKTVTPNAATPTPAYVATPTPPNAPVATTTPTAEPTIRNLHGEDQSKWVPTATPTVTKIPTQVSISQNPNPIKSGASITFTFAVSAKTVPIPGQTVSFDVSGKQLGSATTGSNGYGTFTFSTAGLAPILPAGISVGGTYAGTSQYASSWGTMGYYIIA